MSEEQDRISSLPDAIIHQILSFLPTKHSIQTSILSKRWIHLWKFTSVIDIPMSSPYKDITQSECTFIHNTLTQHRASKLDKFNLKFSIGYLWDVFPDVQHYIEFAISRQVHILSVMLDLCLTFAEPDEYYVLPNMFYSHDNVRSLEQVSLKGFLFNPNPASTLLLPFASLKTLCLFDCTIDDETLKGLLSNCLVLESLTIDRCHRLLYFKASCCQSRSLKHLVFRGLYSHHGLNLEIDVSSLSTVKVYGDLMKISLCHLPLIVEATVFQWRYCPYVQEFHITTWLRNLAHVNKLGVDSWFGKFLAREHKVNNSNRWQIFENLKVFSWFGPLTKESDLIALVAFLAHCPYLDKIEIDFRSSYWVDASEQRPACALEHPFIKLENGDKQVTIGLLVNLKRIIVHHLFGYKSEIEFIKHLLQKAIVLETLSLRLELNPKYYGRRRLNTRPKELVEEEIFSLPRASSIVHILFQDPNQEPAKY